MRSWAIPGSVLLSGLVTTLADGQSAKAYPRDPSPRKVAVSRALEGMPLYFIENCGQLDSWVAYYVQGRDTTLYFTAEGMTLVQTEQSHERNDSKDRLEQASLGRGIPQTPDPGNRWVVKLDFVGANPHPRIEAADPTPAVIGYFKGPQENWKAGLSTYGSIVYSDLWPGIDLVYSGTANRLKYTFLVKPGADPAQVRLAYRGVTGIRLNDAGQLEVETPAGVLQDDRPYAYQEIDGRRVEIGAGYSLDRDSAGGPHRYGFALDSYDRGKPLVLDPAVFVYAGYIGGTGADEGAGIAVDTAGNAYVTGWTAATEATFPVTVGPDLTFNGSGLFRGDAFVAKVNAAGTALVYCGYIGGSGDDQAYDIAVDGSGNAYVTGYTNSTQITFPVTVGPDLTWNFGTYDAFVAKVNAAGTALDYCGYVGGGGPDYGYGIAVDSTGNAYVTGQTGSAQATFPVAVGPDLTFNGSADAFVVKVNPAGTAIVYGGYIGGGFADYGYGIAVDGSSNAYVTGFAQSDETTFPVTVGPDLTYNGGVYDAFVARVDASGTALNYCGYIGGSSNDVGYGIAADNSGNAYVTGYASSTETTFPVIVGPDLTHNGGADTFVTKVNATGTALLYSGYIGGGGADQGNGIAVDGSGRAFVAGYTTSTEATFPVAVGPDLTYNGGVNDAFVANVNAAGTALVYGGYIGGIGDDLGLGIAVDSSGSAYVTGYTLSNETTFPVTVGPDLTGNGGQDAFVAKIGTGPVTDPLTPRPMAVDAHAIVGSASNANGVLESGETVQVAPSWENTLTIDQTFTGTSSNLTGPPGPTYTIDDSSADYGTINAGATGDCDSATDDCYRMTVSGTRPTPHWDATFDETLSLALPKTWTLHVGNSFADVPTSNALFYPFVENLFHNGVTAGGACGGYCPTDNVLRRQMAVFLLKSLLGSGYTPPPATGIVFNDVPASDPFAPWIEDLANRGITGGCASNPPFPPPVFCPTANVLRQQMAVFLLKTSLGTGYTPPPATGTLFNDVPASNPFAPWIEDLAGRGITGGCASNPPFPPPVYCPTANVLRQQMAVFLVKTFSLLLYGP